MLPVVDPDPTAQLALPTPDSYQFFTAYEGTSWNNEDDAADAGALPGL